MAAMEAVGMLVPAGPASAAPRDRTSGFAAAGQRQGPTGLRPHIRCQTRLPLLTLWCNTCRLLRRNVKRFQGGLVFKAHRLVCHSTLGSRVIKTMGSTCGASFCGSSRSRPHRRCQYRLPLPTLWRNYLHLLDQL